MTPDGTDYVSEGPQPIVHEPEPAEPFPLKALGPLQAAAEAAHDITQAPSALAAQSALAVASLAAQAHFNVETLNGQKPLSLFALSVAQSGERKSACDGLLMKAVEGHRLALNDAYRLEIKAYKDELALFEADRKGVMQDRQAKARKGERGADIAALGPEPEPPLLPTVIASDPTVEGLTKHLGQGRPSLGLFSDEGGSFLGGSAMSEDNRLKTVATLSGYWDGSPINRTRAGDGQSTHFGKRLACHLMVQPVAATNLLSDPIANGQGFLARFLIVHPQSTMGTRFYREPETRKPTGP